MNTTSLITKLEVSMFKAEIIDGKFTVTHCGEVIEQNPDWNFLQEAWERADELNEETQ